MAHRTRAGLADFDWNSFAYAVRMKFDQVGGSARSMAPDIGITDDDLNRAMGGGQRVSVPKVMALCRWMGCDIYDYYVPPLPRAEPCRSWSNVKHDGAEDRV